MTNTYHHKNLRHELITTGKKMIHDEGITNFSARKLAAECKVSYAAPKNHFANKNELVKAIADNIGEEFTKYLSDIYQKNKNKDCVLVELGKGYVDYFIKNPNYYKLFFQDTEQTNSIKMSNDGTIVTNFKPFQFFSDVACSFLKNNGVPEKDINEYVISMWAAVHGIASISTSSFFTYNGDILELTENTLNKYKF